MKKTAKLCGIEALLIDMAGTLFEGHREIPGSFEFIKSLDERDIRYCFLTNTAGRTAEGIAQAVAANGLPIAPDRILNPIVAAEVLLKREGLQSFYFAGSDHVRAAFSIDPNNDTNPAIVVLGDLQDVCTYEELNKIYRLISAGARLLTTSYSPYFLTDAGSSLDTGAFTRMFEELTGTKAEVLGKPSQLFFAMALARMDTTPETTVMVGDDVTTDIEGAAALGMRTVLVRTGKFSEDQLKSASLQPDLTIDKLVDLAELIGLS